MDWDFTLNELVPGEPLTAPVEALRCDGHQHAGWGPLSPPIATSHCTSHQGLAAPCLYHTHYRLACCLLNLMQVLGAACMCCKFAMHTTPVQGGLTLSIYYAYGMLCSGSDSPGSGVEFDVILSLHLAGMVLQQDLIQHEANTGHQLSSLQGHFLLCHQACILYFAVMGQCLGAVRC